MMAPARAIRIAILAMGGEGGGVLANWIVDLGEHNGYLAQLTSVPGVAQRTGATIYYIELFPRAAVHDDRQPVLALMPVPGDVDVVIASELMEAGRAIQRGFVTPDRTTLIASTNRVFAMTEKIVMADGRVDEGKILEACRIAAKRFIGLDMARVAEQSGSVISAVMFGAVAAARVLPFERSAFTETIARGGVGVAASTRAFDAAMLAAQKAESAPAAPVEVVVEPGPQLPAEVAAALGPAIAALPLPAQEFATEGVRRLVDYQDLDYARLYLSRLAPIATLDERLAGSARRLTTETARYLALAMSYEDTIRVAELKTRSERFRRVAAEIGAKDGQIVEISEYLHPRLQEIAESVPAPLGRFILRNGLARRLVGALTSSGKTVKTTSLRGFLLLYTVAALKPSRRRTLRFLEETESIEAWLADIARTAETDYDLACEVAECRTLIKGYGDTLERGRKSYATIIDVAKSLPPTRERAAQIARLRAAALADESGSRLATAVAQVQHTASRTGAPRA